MINVNAMMNGAATDAKFVGRAQDTSKKGAFLKEMESAVQKQSPKHVHKTASPQPKVEEIELEDTSEKDAQSQVQDPNGIVPLVMGIDPAMMQATGDAIVQEPLPAEVAPPIVGEPMQMQSIEQSGQTLMQSGQTLLQSGQTLLQSDLATEQGTLQGGHDIQTAVPGNEQSALANIQPIVQIAQTAPQQQDAVQTVMPVPQGEQQDATGTAQAPLAPMIEQLPITADSASESEPVSKANMENEQAQPIFDASEQILAPQSEEENAQSNTNAEGRSFSAEENIDADSITKSTAVSFSQEDDAAATLKPKLEADEAPPIEIKLAVRSAAELQSPQVKEAVAAKIVQGIETLVKTEKNHIKIQMSPDVLGGMTIKLSLAHDGLKVQMLTTGKTTHALVSEQIVQLKNALHERGIQVQQLEVIDQSRAGTSDGFAQPFSHQEQQQSRPRWIPVAANALKEDLSEISALYDSMVRADSMIGTVEFSA